MSDLKYKTRGKSNPQGKARVYFSCFPEDFEPYFEEISEDILKAQDCAIWYDGEPGAPWDAEELMSDLGEMQLFVIPVTGSFLFRNSRARQVEFPFALEHHIPVLPLMQEPGLSEDFNRICGNLQFLDKHVSDITAISYEEKLGKFLESILLGEETVRKIRDSFAAYIFLSYRKKDRKYARYLMRLIHQNKFCRDIAIWYDEFLTPGEDFNDVIGQALEKCHLFTLLVTPNLIEGKNYVMTREYPEACRKKKPILPIEIVPTDAKKLRRKYKGIPDCVSPVKYDSFVSALHRYLDNFAAAGNASDPQHLFYIGLAYLGGVDVEVNHERALLLIQAAAEGGLADAARKLVSMYKTGEGVPRDYAIALEWQEKLAEARRKQQEETPQNDGAFEKWLEELANLGSDYYELGRMARAEQTFETMYSSCRDRAETWANRDYYLARACIWRGTVADAESRPDRAALFWGEAIESLSRSARKAETPWLLAQIIRCHRDICRIRIQQGRYSEASKLCLEAARLQEQFQTKLENNPGASREDRAGAQRSLAEICRLAADIAEGRGDYQDAAEKRLRAVRITRELAEETGLVMDRHNLSAYLGMLGKLCLARGERDRAKTYHRQALEITEGLVRETGMARERRALAVTYDHLGSVSLAEGNLREAREYFLKGLELSQALAQETGSARDRHGLQAAFSALGVVSEREQDWQAAREYYRKQTELAREAAERTGTVEARADLAQAYCNLAGVCSAQQDIKPAEESYQESIALLEALVRESQDVALLRKLAHSYHNMGALRAKEKNRSEAAAYYKKSLEILRPLAERTGSIEIYDSLLLSCNNLGATLGNQGDLPEAERYLRQGLETAETLLEKTDNLKSCLRIASCYRVLCWICRDAKKPEEAKLYARRAIELCEELAKRAKTPGLYIDMARSYNNFGLCCESEGNLREAEIAYRRAIELLEGLSGTTSAERYHDLSVYYNNLGRVLELGGNRAEADLYYAKAKERHIPAPIASMLCEGKDCHEIAKLFQEAGFKNIHLVKFPFVEGANVHRREGEVISVGAAEKSTFEQGELFGENDEIRIGYASLVGYKS